MPKSWCISPAHAAATTHESRSSSGMYTALKTSGRKLLPRTRRDAAFRLLLIHESSLSATLNLTSAK